jgi:plastocyanin
MHRALGVARSVIGGVSMIVLVVARGYSNASTPSAIQPIAVSAAVSRIGIQNFKFDPPTITVPAGTTVTWINRDDSVHTVTSEDGRLASAGLNHGEQFSYRFTVPGTYAYHCALHPHMMARIVVQ